MTFESIISDRIKYLKGEEFKAIAELDKCPVGSMFRAAKWAFIRELGYRRNELEITLDACKFLQPLMETPKT